MSFKYYGISIVQIQFYLYTYVTSLLLFSITSSTLIIVTIAENLMARTESTLPTNAEHLTFRSALYEKVKIF